MTYLQIYMHILRSIYIIYIYTGYILVLEKPSSTGNQMCLRTNPLTGWWNVTGQSLAGRTHSLIFVCGWARASATPPGSDYSPRWLSPPHLRLSGINSGQRTQSPVVTGAYSDVVTGAIIGKNVTRHERWTWKCGLLDFFCIDSPEGRNKK